MPSVCGAFAVQSVHNFVSNRFVLRAVRFLADATKNKSVCADRVMAKLLLPVLILNEMIVITSYTLTLFVQCHSVALAIN